VPESVTIGVIGCGSVARNAYLPLIVNLRSQGKVTEIVGCDLDPARLAEVQAKFGITRVTTDPDELIRDPSVDVVVVLTSMAEHASLTVRALEAGKHVLVEKPMATTLEDGRRVLAAAEASAGMLVCAPHVQLSPDFQEMYRAIDAGRVGRPVLGRARYGWDGPDWSAWFYGPGGGPLFDLGVYNVTSLTGLIGPARRVTCLSAKTRNERTVAGEVIAVETDDTFQIVIEHDGGALSTITTAFGMQKYRGAAVEVYGLEGTIQLLGDDWAPAGIEYWSNEVGAWQLFDSAGQYWPWTDGLAHLVNCIIAGERPYTRPDHAFHVLEIMLGAMAASETGITQGITSTFERQPPRPSMRRADAHLVHDRVHEDAQ
jgi:predicted dehydrogenase